MKSLRALRRNVKAVRDPALDFNVKLAGKSIGLGRSRQAQGKK
jgi:hypothetical protein